MVVNTAQFRAALRTAIEDYVEVYASEVSTEQELREAKAHLDELINQARPQETSRDPPT